MGERNETYVYESATYWEAPNDDKSSVILSPWFYSDTLEGWRGETTIAYKRVVYRDDRNIVAFQGGALWVSHRGGCSEGGGAGRGLSGGCEGARLSPQVTARSRTGWR